MRRIVLILLSTLILSLPAARIAGACGGYGAFRANITGTIESVEPPLAPYRVSARCGEATVTTLTDAAGRFALRGLEDNSCLLTVAARDGERELTIVSVRVTTPARDIRVIVPGSPRA